MSIREDIDFMLAQHKEKSKIEKSRAAMRILRRFDQVKESMRSRESGLEDYALYQWVPPTLREIVRNYTEGKISSDTTYKQIARTKTEARAYFVEKGCDPVPAEQEHEEYLADHEKILKQEQTLFDKVGGLIAKVMPCKRKSLKVL